MRHKYIMIAAMAALPMFFAAPAKASNDYCREYTKTIRVGGNLESGYGRACLRPDGSWEIVSTHGSLEPHEIFPQEISRRLVYYNNYYVPPPVYYYPRVTYYKPWPPGHYKHRRDWDRHDRDWDHHDRGHGRGHHR